MVNKKNKVIITFVILLSTILVGIFFYFYSKVNNKYQAPVLSTYKIQESFKFSYNPDFELKVIDFKILNENELKNLSDSAFSEVKIPDQESVGFLVTLNIKNTSDHESSIESHEFMIESGAFANGTDIAYSLLLNENVKSGSYMPGEERTLILPFTAIESLLSKEHWENIKKLKFDLVTSLYPVEQKVLLN